MSTEISTALAVNAPAAAAVLGATFMFLRFAHELVTTFFKDRREDRLVWENHLSNTVRTLEKIATEQFRQGEDARRHHEKIG